MKHFGIAVVIILAAAVFRGCDKKSSPPANATAARIEVTMLGYWPTTQLVTSVSDNGLHVAAVQESKCRVDVDGKPGAVYDWINTYSLVFSHDGKRLAYIAKRGSKNLVALVGEAESEHELTGEIGYFAVPHKPNEPDQKASLWVSPDGERVAYVALKGQESVTQVSNSVKKVVVVDSQAGPEYDDCCWGVFSIHPQFAMDLSLESEDGQPVFSLDGKRVAYSARKNGEAFAVLDGQPGPAFQDVKFLVFSADAKHVAYSATKGRKSFVVVDGQPGPEFGETSHPIFSPDSNRVAYRAKEDGKSFVVVDGHAGPEYDDELIPVFSPDSKRVAYLAAKGNTNFVVVDGQKGPEYDGTGCPVFSPDSKRVGYWARKGDKLFVMTDGQAGPEYDDIGCPVFSPDSKRAAYWAKKGDKSFVVTDGREGLGYSHIGTLAFSLDNKHFAYQASKDNKQFVIVDGERGPEYESVVENGPTFDSDGVLRYLAVKGGSLYRVTVAPAQW